LKGVGEYTAAAIASICFHRPTAVVDGNVYRVLARVFGIEIPIDSTAGRKQFKELAMKLLDAKHPGDHNQAVMELGATVCTPKSPIACGARCRRSAPPSRQALFHSFR
jgi:A/G-specific adenine glycosylase